jgi:hypothetical protein
MEPNFYMDLAGNVGSLGFILWLVWRTTNHTIPRLARDFKEGLDKQRSDFKDTSAMARTDFLSQLAEQRTNFKDQLERERELNRKQVDQFLNAVSKIKNGE